MQAPPFERPFAPHAPGGSSKFRVAGSDRDVIKRAEKIVSPIAKGVGLAGESVHDLDPAHHGPVSLFDRVARARPQRRAPPRVACQHHGNRRRHHYQGCQSEPHSTMLHDLRYDNCRRQLFVPPVERRNTMKKLIPLILGLSLALGTVAVTFAQDTPKKDGGKKASKKKGGKKKEETPKKDGGQ